MFSKVPNICLRVLRQCDVGVSCVGLYHPATGKDFVLTDQGCKAVARPGGSGKSEVEFLPFPNINYVNILKGSWNTNV